MKWPVPTNCTEVRSFVGGNTILVEVQYFVFNGSCTTPHNNNGH
jgi:hypothetical protein